MSPAHHLPLTFDTFEAFIDWEHRQEGRHELVDGVPVAMTGANEGHNVIQMNIAAALHSQLRGGPCRPFMSDMAMKTGVRSGRYPDVSVDCGPRNAANRALPHPVVVFEILSASTQGEDRTVKMPEYNDVRSIQQYVIVEPSEPLLHVYSRGETGEFRLRAQEIRGLDGTVDLPSIAASLPMGEIYDSLSFDPAHDGPEPTPSPWAG